MLFYAGRARPVVVKRHRAFPVYETISVWTIGALIASITSQLSVRVYDNTYIGPRRRRPSRRRTVA